MLIKNIIQSLAELAPPAYQENYDNATLITGDPLQLCTGILCTLDVTNEVINEAIEKNCNLIVAHHPVLFRGLKSLSGNSYVEKAIVKAIKSDMALYAIHTNLDNVKNGVNQAIAGKLRLQQTQVLQPKEGLLCKLYTYAPLAHTQKVKDALFAAGAGKIGLYEQCSFAANGSGTFKPTPGANPFVGETDNLETIEETKIEVIFPAYLQKKILTALFAAHPYETVAYEIIRLENHHQEVGSGMIGELPEETGEADFLQKLKTTFNVPFIKHTALLNKKIKRVAVCGGSGSFLTSKAIAAGADIYVTSDVKYHEFFDAEGRIVLADIGHWESEQFTIDLISAFLQQNLPTFAVLKTSFSTNPVHYL